MKGYYEATRKKPQTVGEFLKKTSDRNYASEQIYKHNMKEGTTKLKLTGDKIYSNSGNGYAPVNIRYDSNMEFNALTAIRMFTSTSVSLAPSIGQLYEMRRTQEKEFLQSIVSSENYSKQDKQLKIKLLEHKRECLDKFQEEIIGIRDFRILEACQKILTKEQAEIDWIQRSYGSSHYDFFNSEYARSFGFIAENNPVNNNPQNPEPDEESESSEEENQPDNGAANSNNQNPNQSNPEAPGQGAGGGDGNSGSNNQNSQNQGLGQQNSSNQSNSNPDEDELMLQELMTQIELMKQEQIKITRALEDKDHQLQTETDKNIDLTNKLATEKELTKELTDKNNDLTDQVKNLNVKVSDLTEKLDVSEEKNAGLQSKFDESQTKVKPLEEKVLDLKHYNKQLEDDKIDLRETQKDMREVQKMLIEDKKLLQKISAEDKELWLEDKKVLVEEKNYYFGLSTEQADKIGLLEQVHCNVLEHEWMNVKPTGDMSVQTD